MSKKIADNILHGTDFGKINNSVTGFFGGFASQVKFRM